MANTNTNIYYGTNVYCVVLIVNTYNLDNIYSALIILFEISALLSLYFKSSIVITIYQTNPHVYKL